MALSYLAAGAPFVLANLWDVTDKDIDKLSISCMGSALGGRGEAVSWSLVQSRAVCKLGHIVGSSPVLYGIPAHLEEVGSSGL
jgi:separase